MKVPILLMALLVFIAGCIGQAQPVLTLHDGERCIEYAFRADVRKLMEIPVEGKLEIQELLLASPKINILFESNQADNKGFSLAGFVIADKLKIYNIYVLGRVPEIRGYELANATGLSGLNIMLRGPNTGAKATAISLRDGTIFVEGLDEGAIGLAGERLALVLLEDLVGNRAQEELYRQRCQA